ncbi:MAG: bifunctional metallophosphatase/5'-nucleotidase, partial [Bacteroidales bacterium]|nr:bifunctional metallophosphatase/5'-nucleotidase [Bacteroidales bacterium]
MTNPNSLLKRLSLALALAFSSYAAHAQSVNILYTTDTHGSIFNYDFVRDTVADYCLSNAYTYIQQVRDTSNVILLDNGDFLQGAPSVYYYNYIDTSA